MFRKLLLSLLALMPGAWAFAQHNATHSVDIGLRLTPRGDALVEEVWDVELYHGTEYYLVRENLDGMTISGLSVTDETGRGYTFEERWNVDRSLQEKALRCGFHKTSGGVEICWGLGAFGRHVYTVRYRMDGAVQSFDDYDALHIQLVSPGVSPLPQRVNVSIRPETGAFSEDNTGLWAFGYEGTALFGDGSLELATDRPFRSSSNSVIVLARFDKGMFSPRLSAPGSFQNHLEKAFGDSDYDSYLKQQRWEKAMGILVMVLAILFVPFCLILFAISIRKYNERVFGVKKLKEIGYERDVPFGGDILATRYVLKGGVGTRSEAQTASAMILKMLKEGYIAAERTSSSSAQLSFRSAGKDPSTLSRAEKELFDMLKTASGDDLVLQDREWSRFSSRNSKDVANWVEGLSSQGYANLAAGGYRQSVSPLVLTSEGQKQARRAVGLRKYLKDFTLLDERRITEVSLWGDYIIFAALFGIADKIAKELKEIDPKAFEEYVGYDYPTMRHIIRISDRAGGYVSGAVHAQTAASVAGRGGAASIGGGGGFRGGGFGGGVR